MLLSALFNDPARASTLLLTSLMVIGLGFFIRASTKDRIETQQFGSLQTAEALQQAVVKYFYSRAYRLLDSSAQSGEADLSGFSENSAESLGGDHAIADFSQPVSQPITLVGMVSPSLFLAIFLSLLAAVGFACLALIVATLFPSWGGLLLGLTLASPLAGRFYWQKSSRPETVVLKVESLKVKSSKGELKAAQGFLSKLTVKGHRDEIADLQSAFAQADLKAWAGLKKWEGTD